MKCIADQGKKERWNFEYEIMLSRLHYTNRPN